MSFLYRAALTVTRKQPYIDWANSFEDGGPQLTEELSTNRRTVYLVPEYPQAPDLKRLVDTYWETIFDEELAVWMENEDDWPEHRTRAMFDAWFDVESTDSVFDLASDQPLTHAEVELDDFEYALDHCAWCGIDVERGTGRYTGFKVAVRGRFAHREGLTIAVPIDNRRIAIGVVSPEGSDEAQAGDDLLFTACASGCEKALRKHVPKALRNLTSVI